MASLENNLYPPIVDTYAPAFIYNDDQQGCKIYLNISQLNDQSDLHHDSNNNIDLVQVTVKDQKTNYSVLKEQDYPTGIKCVTLTKEEDKGYFFKIFKDDLQEGAFELNKYYKVQIRFTTKDADELPQKNFENEEHQIIRTISYVSNSWISKNISNFSEWSSIVLIQGISRPILSIADFQTDQLELILKYSHIFIDGKVIFENINDTQTLKSYQVFLYQRQNNDNILLEKSQVQNFISKDSFTYSFRTKLQKNKSYKMKIIIITKSFYQLEKEYNFKIANEFVQFKDFDITISEDSNLGCININLVKNQEQSEGGNNQNLADYQYDEQTSTLIGALRETNGDKEIGFFSYNDNDNTLTIYKEIIKSSDVSDESKKYIVTLQKVDQTNLSPGMHILIKRSSSRTNFKEWEDLGTLPVSLDNTNYIQSAVWKDFSVQPGVWYKYDFLKCNAQNNRLGICENENAYMIDSWDIFISDKKRQLRIMLDPQISNFSIKSNESIIETIGSQYPFIRKNNIIKYKTFSLSGTISAFMDFNYNTVFDPSQDIYKDYKDFNFNTFDSSKQQLYKDSKISYENYNKNNNISYFNDFIYQKFFREQVMDFLQQSNVKLFRSLTQGNMLVKLSNITFTPNITLGRRIYNFSCTVYEVADASTLEDINKYKIMNDKCLSII